MCELVYVCVKKDRDKESRDVDDAQTGMGGWWGGSDNGGGMVGKADFWGWGLGKRAGEWFDRASYLVEPAAVRGRGGRW